jgi:hypothetical protein
MKHNVMQISFAQGGRVVRMAITRTSSKKSFPVDPALPAAQTVLRKRLAWLPPVLNFGEQYSLSNYSELPSSD